MEPCNPPPAPGSISPTWAPRDYTACFSHSAYAEGLNLAQPGRLRFSTHRVLFLPIYDSCGDPVMSVLLTSLDSGKSGALKACLGHLFQSHTTARNRYLSLFLDFRPRLSWVNFSSRGPPTPPHNSGYINSWEKILNLYNAILFSYNNLWSQWAESLYPHYRWGEMRLRVDVIFLVKS
jgi:hypothetical protein